MKDKIIVNGTEVEYLDIQQKPDGTMVINFSEKFNILLATPREIAIQLMKNNFKSTVTKYLNYKIIVIYLADINELHGVLNCLNIPVGTYEINYEDLLVTIDTPLLENPAVEIGKMGNLEVRV